MLQRLTRGHHFRHQSDRESLLGRQPLAQQHHSFGPLLAHQPGQLLGAKPTRQQAHRTLRKCHLCMLLGNAHITGQRNLQATAHGVAINSGNAHTLIGA